MSSIGNINVDNLTPEQRDCVSLVDHNIIVSAGAGSGKTHVLTLRYLKILENNPNVLPENILAITYTEKAGKEMRTRILSDLNALYEKDPNNKRLNQIIENLKSAHIGTIHSLCKKILNENQIFLNFDISQGVSDTITTDKYIEKAINDSLIELVENNDECLNLLEIFDVDDIIKNIKNYLKTSFELKQLVEKSKNLSPELILQNYNHNAQFIIDHAINKLFYNDLKYYQNQEPASDKCNVKEGYIYANSLIEKISAYIKINSISLNEVIQLIKDFNVNFQKCRQKTCNGHDSLKKFREIIRNFTKYIDYPLNENDEKSALYLFYFLRLILKTQENFQKYKVKFNIFDFDDMISLSLEILKNADIQKKYSNKYQYIMLDEFQDSNYSQLKLVSLLSSNHTKYFFIGDDKQSIYKFQGASVEVFNSIKNKFLNLESNNYFDFIKLNGDSQVITLSQNFRSVSKIVDFVNLLFKNVLKSDYLRVYDCRYTNLISSIETQNKSSVKIINTSSNREKSDFHSDCAKAIISEILNLKNQNFMVLDKNSKSMRTFRLNDIAILLSKNSYFANYENLFDKYKIKYKSFRKSGLLTSQEILDIINYTKFILDKNDYLSLIAILRSPLFNFDDSFIYNLRLTQNDYTYDKFIEQINTIDLTQDQNDSISNFVNISNQLFKLLNTHTNSQFLAELVEITNFNAIVLNIYQDRIKCANIAKFINFAQSYNHLTLREFIEFIDNKINANQDEAIALDQDYDGINIMTIHGSKGLEFPIVFIPVIDSLSSNDKSKIIFDEEFGIAFNPVKESSRSDDKPNNSNFFNLLKLERKNKEESEKKRLFYVAVTRARDALILLNNKANNKSQFNKFLNDNFESIANDSKFNNLVDICELNVDVVNIPCDLNLDSTISKIDLNFDLIKPLEIDYLKLIPQDNFYYRYFTDENYDIEARLIGTYFHKLMENLPQNLDYPKINLFENIASKFAVINSVKYNKLVEIGKILIEKFYHSKLKVLMQDSKKIFYEMPLLQFDSSKQRPDLFILDKNDIWHVIDYKTDKIDQSETSSHISQHKNQVSHYSKLLNQIFNNDFNNHIYFSYLGDLVQF